MNTLKPLGAYSSTAELYADMQEPKTERDEMPARLRRIGSHQITHERAAVVIEELMRELAEAQAEIILLRYVEIR